MPKFSDADGRSWSVCLSIADVKRVRQELDVDLLDLAGGELFARLLVDPVLIVDILHVVLAQQAECHGLDAMGFARAMRGDAIEDATQALLEGLVDFFPKRQREVLRTALAASDRWIQRESDRAKQLLEGPELDQALETHLARLDDTIERTMHAHLAALGGGPSPSGPPSPASPTPDP